MTLTASAVNNANLVLPLLQEVFSLAEDAMNQGYADASIPQRFQYTGPAGLTVSAWSTNNRIMTWTVFSEALSAVFAWMYENRSAATRFTVYNGAEVGQGTIE